MRKKTDKIVENFFTSNIFLFNSHACICQQRKAPPYPGEPPFSILSLKADTSCKIKFAFGSKIGLVRLNDDGSIAEKNILGKLLAIDNSNVENYYDFFFKNGFLLPISANKCDDFGITELSVIIDRLHATLELMSAITDISRASYDKIVRMIFFLLFSPTVSIDTKDGNYKYESSRNPYTKFLDNALNLSRSNELLDTFNNETFTISDTISNYTLNAQLIDDMWSGSETPPIYQEELYKKVFFAYSANRATINPSILKINDFIFHYFSDVGLISQVTLNDTYYYKDAVSKENFTEELRKSALEVAKIILKYEIDSNLKRVKVAYNINKMEPTWNIDSLLSALYFGLFYMRPSMETYRRCASSKCNEFFLVPISSQKKKYCCKRCQDREMAARKRIADKKKCC